MKKSNLIIYLIIFSAIILIPFASAAMDFKGSSEKIIQIIKDVFGPFFGALIGTGDFDKQFFAKVLLLILLYSIIVTVMKKIELFKRQTSIIIIISAIVSILGTRYISETNFVNFVMLPYGTLALAITVFLPLFIFFYFVETTVKSSVGRRMAWVLFALVFFGLWFSRIKDFGGFSFSAENIKNWLYIIGVFLVGLFFFFDKEIQKYFNLHFISDWKEKNRNLQIGKLQADLAKLSGVHSEHAKRAREDIEDQLKDLGAKPA